MQLQKQNRYVNYHRRRSDISIIPHFLLLPNSNHFYHQFQEKAAQTLDFIMSVVGRLESDKHSLALKEIVALTSR